MRKITALALPLLFGAVTASAQVGEQVTTLEELTTGWYQIQMTGTCTADANYENWYVINAEDEYSNDSYPLKFQETIADDNAPIGFIYIDQNGSNRRVQSANGHWLTSLAKGSLTPQSTSFTAQTDGTFRIADDWGYHQGYVGRFGSGRSANHFTITKAVVDGYDQYTVSITEPALTYAYVNSHPRVTCVNENVKGLAKVYNNGTFFFPQGTTVSAEDFTSDVTNYDAHISVDGTSKTITVTYTYKLASLQGELVEAQRVHDISGIGAPVEGATVRTDLQNAINAVKSALESGSTEYESLSSQLNTAYMAYVNADVVMPKVGKAYTLTVVQKNGVKHYLNYNEAGYEVVATTDANNSNYPMTATFICTKVGDKYVFVNNAGKYLIFRDGKTNSSEGEGANDNKGYEDSYVERTCTLTVAKMAASAGTDFAYAGDGVGYLSILGARTTGKGNSYIIVNGTQNKFDRAGNTFFKLQNGDYFSSAISVEEVSYDNEVSPNYVDNIEGVSNNIATFSAPFATVVPEGVKAYYIASIADEKAVMTEIEIAEGEAIPANTGVILTAASNDDFTMVPATSETAATVENNMLEHSAGEAKFLSEIPNAYILTSGSNGVGFYPTEGTLKMNKAYLVTEGNAAAIALNFGQATGIDTVTGNAANTNAPIFDLSGRRVVKAVKGGLYIQNGKKFIVK